MNILNSSITPVYLSTIINHINKYYAQKIKKISQTAKNTLHLFPFQDFGIRERCDGDTQCENGTINSFCNETSGFVSVKQDLCF